jgi:hypothetical protein
MITWNTPQGNLGTKKERETTSITLSATSDVGAVTYTVIAGSLPRGLRLIDNAVKGSPAEVKSYTTSRFVIRAQDSEDLEDRTFSLSVDGADAPEWITKEGYLQVGNGEAYFVLDNSRVNFQLESYDTDLIAGDKLEYYLIPMGGQLPPGLSLSRSGVISGFTDPIFAIDYDASLNGGYDTGAFDVTPIDFVEAKSNGFDDYFYDNVTYDYSEPSRSPKRLSRSYSFVIAVTDGATVVRQSFKIYVVTEEFLTADNSIVQISTNVFTADASSDRVPLWISDSNLGRYRSNNYVTLFLDVYDPPSLPGTITYFLLPTNNNGSPSVPPPGLELDSVTGELAGVVPYQSKISKTYSFTVEAVNFPSTLYSSGYTLVGNWNTSINYSPNQAVKYLNYIYICTKENRAIIPTNTTYWTKGVSSAAKTFNVEIVGEIESAVRWVSNESLGTIRPNQPSQLFVEANTVLYGGRANYKKISGDLPIGLELLSDGKIQGKIKQFADATGPGLTRFYEKTDSAAIDSTPSRDFTGVFDGDTTTFDRKFTFVVEASDASGFSKIQRTFYFTVTTDADKTFSNLYLKAFQSKEKRLAWSNFITDANIFKPSDLYRPGDINFGVQTELKMLLFAGIESTAAEKYVSAMGQNHYRKQILFGDIKTSKARDPDTQETIYEVVYVDIKDDLEKEYYVPIVLDPALYILGARLVGRQSISSVVELPNNINSPVLVSTSEIKIDSNVPLASDRDHQRIFPNSIYNMRNRLSEIGERDRTFLPLWMRSIQDDASYETGYVKGLILCYTLPNKSQDVVARIQSKTNYASRGEWSGTIAYQINDSVIYAGNYWTCIKENSDTAPFAGIYWIENFNFSNINFTADRYLIDILDGEIEAKYLAFPQRGEKLP